MSTKNDNKISDAFDGSCSAGSTEKESIKGSGVSERRSKTAQIHETVAGPSGERIGGPSGDVGVIGRTFPDVPPGKPKTLTKTQKRNRRRKQKKVFAFASAIDVSAEGPTKDDSGRKRLASELTPSTGALQTMKRPRQETLWRSYHDMAKTTKLAVVKVDFPTGKLQKAEADIIQIDILNRIDKIPDGDHLPVITSTVLSGGAVMLSFEDKATEDWIRNSFKGNTNTIEGVELKVLGMDEMPKPVKVAFRTKDTITGDPEVLLKRLQRYNPELKTDSWKVRQRLSEPQSTRWIFEVGLEAAEAITKAGCSAFTGLDKGSFKILFDPNAKKGEEEEGGKDAILPSPSPPRGRFSWIKLPR